MSAPRPPAPTSRTVAVVCGTLAGLLTAVVLTIAAAGVYEWATLPIVAPADSLPSLGPLPAATAAPAPITPVALTTAPLTGRGPR